MNREKSEAKEIGSDERDDNYDDSESECEFCRIHGNHDCRICPYCENEKEPRSGACRSCYMEIYGIPDDDLDVYDSESDSGYESNQ